ncbi:MAG TPA: argininosuccinate lyase [Chthoniobacterales bacterium]|jgi:argininosuccinate lyase|nr:argininosuccinate lyase [Chthoniobacterales bacterium]
MLRWINMRKGRFRKSLARSAARFSESVSFDRRLYRHDIAGSVAHAAELARAGIISPAEQKKIQLALREIEKEIASGKFEWDQSLEDVHMNIESALTKKIGDTGAKLHTARSRNDQVALDLRLYIKEEIKRTSAQLKKLQRAFLALAGKYVDLVMPGYTHLQRAQPILFAHYLLGQIEAFARDSERLDDCFRRTDVLPLGSGALAGSTIVLNRELIARDFGFTRVSQNSLDAVSDRDFAAEFIFCLAMIGMHLSRLSEDLIIWSTSEFGFVEFSESFSTGSSLMPQKKNPDMAELARGKAGRLYGNLMSILTTLKALPSSYNRDLQEDKEALFDSVDTISAALEVFSEMVPQLKFSRERMKAAAADPQLLATDLAEYLVKKGAPFREAHEIVGRVVSAAIARRKKLDEILLVQLRKFSKQFDADVVRVFDVRRSLAARMAIGAPSPKNVKAQLKSWRERLR